MARGGHLTFMGRLSHFYLGLNDPYIKVSFFDIHGSVISQKQIDSRRHG